MGSFWNDTTPHTIRASAAITITNGCLRANETSLAIIVCGLLNAVGELQEHAAVGHHLFALSSARW